MARPLTSLPAEGRVLVESGNGPWIVSSDGSKRRLGSYDDASWSPHGLFVAATRPGELVALDPKGNVRWSLARGAGVHEPRWAPDGFRIAYLSGASVRVVAGDGTGDRALGVSAQAAPAWRPGPGHVLAYAGPKGDLRVVDADTGRALWRAFGSLPTELLWSADGSRLLALAPDALRVYDRAGRMVGTRALPAGTRAETAAFATSGRRSPWSLALRQQAAAASRWCVPGPVCPNAACSPAPAGSAPSRGHRTAPGCSSRGGRRTNGCSSTRRVASARSGRWSPSPTSRGSSTPGPVRRRGSRRCRAGAVCPRSGWGP